jgi:hypothetical protein
VVAIIVEGQKNRPIQMAYQSPPPPPIEVRRPVPSSVFVLLGLGVVGVGGFATFAAIGLTKKDDLNGSCAPFCSESAVRLVKADFAVGDVALGVGVLSLGTAALLFLARPEVAWRPGPAPARSGALVPVLDVDLGANVRAVRIGARF